jgi:hypothetical protein
LFPHAAGVWAKKIRGKLHYFGRWVDSEGIAKLALDTGIWLLKEAVHGRHRVHRPL